MTTSGFDAAIAQIEGIADRLEDTAPALERCAEAGADALRRGIEEQGLVGSGELLESAYASGASFGARAGHAGYVNEETPFVPVDGGELTEPLRTKVREIVDAHVRGDG